MIAVLVVAAVACLYGLVRGGSLDELAATRFRFGWLLFAGLVLQAGFALWDPDWLIDRAGVAILVGTNAIVSLFLALNVRLPGMVLAATGLALNVVVIAANGAMPVSLEAADVAGMDNEGSDLGVKHEPLDEDTLFPWLGDVIPVPGLSMLISVGDLVLAAGIGRLVYRRTVYDLDAPAGEKLANSDYNK